MKHLKTFESDKYDWYTEPFPEEIKLMLQNLFKEKEREMKELLAEHLPQNLWDGGLGEEILRTLPNDGDLAYIEIKLMGKKNKK